MGYGLVGVYVFLFSVIVNYSSVQHYSCL